MMARDHITSLTSIVAFDLRGAIGCRNELPWRLKTDLAFFRTQTIGNSIIMGRKTFESLGSKCLPKRDNIILSHNGVLFPATDTCKLALSVDEALFVACEFGNPKTFVVGGAQTYVQFDRLVDRYLITVVDHEVADADTFLSKSVMSSIRTWDRREIGSHPAVDGQDDYAFSVFELTAPDIESRAAERSHRIARFAENVRPSKRHSRRRSDQEAFSQNVFAF